MMTRCGRVGKRFDTVAAAIPSLDVVGLFEENLLVPLMAGFGVGGGSWY